MLLCKNIPNVLKGKSDIEDDKNLSAKDQVLSYRNSFPNEYDDNNIDRQGESKSNKPKNIYCTIQISNANV